jgi:CRISPR system Cascade subunit CasB
MSLQPAAAVAWWRSLQPGRNRSGDRVALARLRRCATVAEALQEQATIALFRRCGGASPEDLPDAGLATAVLAYVREDDPAEPRIARRIGPDSTDKPETALLKPLRFRRLMEAHSPDERLTVLRQMIALAGGKLNVADLAATLLRWNEERRRHWVYDYWNAGQPTAIAPAAKETAHESLFATPSADLLPARQSESR